MPLDPVTVGSTVAGVAAGVWAVIERFRAERARLERNKATDSQKIVEVKDELIKVIQQARDAWKDKYESEHGEFLQYRTDTHNKINEANSMVLRYSAEAAELRAKTDMTPVLEHQREQSLINVKMLESQTKIVTALDLLIENIVHNQQAARIQFIAPSSSDSSTALLSAS